MSALLHRVAKVLRETLDDDKLNVGLDTSPATVDEWDSVAQVKLFLALETEFDVAFSPDELASINSVRDIIASLEAHGVGATTG